MPDSQSLSSQSNSPFSPLQYRSFRIIWLATLMSNLGALIQSVGAGWMMAEMTPSHSIVALVQASTTLPIMLMAIPSGALADNRDRRLVMLFSQAFMAIISAALAVAAWQDWISPAILLCFTFLLGVGSALHMPSWQASVRDLVPLKELPNAVTLNSMSFNMMRAIGPAIGGLLVASAGPSAAFALNAFSYLALIYALYLWRPTREPKSLPAERLGSAVVAGLRYVLLSPNLMRVMLRGMVFAVPAVILMALLPIVARDLLQAKASTYGILLGAFGFGAILGALASPWLRKTMTLEHIIQLGFVIFAVGLTIVAMSPWLALTLLGTLLAGTAWVLILSLFNVSTQLSAPRWVVGRAIAIYQALLFGSMAAGSWLWGWVSGEYGATVALLIAAGLLIVGALIGLIWPMPDLSDADLDPANLFHEPALRLNLTARSGPIMIMIDWDIPEKDTSTFLDVMTQRRRVQIRDGAQQWTLMRDLENPDIWVETYHVPTWNEYLRHHQRLTRSDAEIISQLRQLHRGPGLPNVHRMIERRTAQDYADLPIFERPKTP